MPATAIDRRTFLKFSAVASEDFAGVPSAGLAEFFLAGKQHRSPPCPYLYSDLRLVFRVTAEHGFYEYVERIRRLGRAVKTHLP